MSAEDKIIAHGLELAIGDVTARVRDTWWARGDSPIEILLFKALQIEAIFGFRGHYDFCGFMAPPRGKRYERSWAEGVDIPLVVESQIEIEGYRVDYIASVDAPDGSRHEVIIECDGHDYHERTKEQAARDRSRDRELQAAGYPVLRFTGSEINTDPCKCARQIIDFLDEMFCAENRRTA